ncbi:MAG: exo-alpha-sialidase [Runella slithyformis]|nr:MAG: exo-alpha-sialidase [Runella slithyformis]
MKYFLAFVFIVTSIACAQANPVFGDTTKTYAIPTLLKMPKGEVLMSWTEKDQQGITAFCLAISTDNGATFADKKTIYASAGVSGSRLMRPKILAKKDGTLVAIFSHRNNNSSGKRSLDIMHCSSKDNGNTWTAPQSVDNEPTTGIVRGFFDAAVLTNNEIAVAYLKDVAGSTKHEERDLRLVITKNGVFQPEKVIDPVVCDCCNISLLVDAKGALNVYYRDNNDDVRDIALMTSTDNGVTFSASKILHNDKWLIKGCPHSGAVSAAFGEGALVTWFSGTETEKGLRLVTQDGQKLAVVGDASAKNSYVATDKKNAVLVWEQNNSNLSQIAFRKVNGNEAPATTWLNDSKNGTNASSLLVGNQLIVAYEVKQANRRNTIKVSRVEI